MLNTYCRIQFNLYVFNKIKFKIRYKIYLEENK